MQARSLALRRQGKTISFVPTMGYLHDGHASLMRDARPRADILAVSIFVNPTQFGPNEDLAAYPRNLPRDMAICAQNGVDIVFTPRPADIYLPGHETYISLERLPEHLCGLSRPGHFRGVATVVAKLFNIVLPDVAVFGEKDFQQLAVIRRMVKDLNFPVEIIGCPTRREEDGLAMSSRNACLNPEERAFAPALYRALAAAREQAARGETRAEALVQAVVREAEKGPGARVDYIKICDPESLEEVAEVKAPAVMALAVFVGKTRLIDNMILEPAKTEKLGGRR
jgi:pantoate--beta-alanine ligase